MKTVEITVKDLRVGHRIVIGFDRMNRPNRFLTVRTIEPGLSCSGMHVNGNNCLHRAAPVIVVE